MKLAGESLSSANIRPLSYVWSTGLSHMNRSFNHDSNNFILGSKSIDWLPISPHWHWMITVIIWMVCIGWESEQLWLVGMIDGRSCLTSFLVLHYSIHLFLLHSIHGCICPLKFKWGTSWRGTLRGSLIRTRVVKQNGKTHMIYKLFYKHVCDWLNQHILLDLTTVSPISRSINAHVLCGWRWHCAPIPLVETIFKSVIHKMPRMISWRLW